MEGGNRGRDGKERRRLEEEGWVRGRGELEGRREQLTDNTKATRGLLLKCEMRGKASRYTCLCLKFSITCTCRCIVLNSP